MWYTEQLFTFQYTPCNFFYYVIHRSNFFTLFQKNDTGRSAVVLVSVLVVMTTGPDTDWVLCCAFCTYIGTNTKTEHMTIRCRTCVRLVSVLVVMTTGPDTDWVLCCTLSTHLMPRSEMVIRVGFVFRTLKDAYILKISWFFKKILSEFWKFENLGLLFSKIFKKPVRAIF